jgi:hypothetical protein
VLLFVFVQLACVPLPSPQTTNSRKQHQTNITKTKKTQNTSAREMRRAYYSPLAYAATKLALDGVLLRALPAVLFALPFYGLMGLSSAPGALATFVFSFVAFNAAVGALALALAAALDSPGKTVLAMNLVLLVGVLFAGFLANKESIPAPLRWITYLSVFRCVCFFWGGGRGGVVWVREEGVCNHKRRGGAKRHDQRATQHITLTKQLTNPNQTHTPKHNAATRGRRASSPSCGRCICTSPRPTWPSPSP